MKKELCAKLVIYKEYTERHGKQNIKCYNIKQKFKMFTATSAYCDVIFEFLCRGRQNKYSEMRGRRSK